MLSFFKSNNPGVVIFYVLYLALFRICAFFALPATSFVLHHREPLSAVTFSFLNKVHADGAAWSLFLSAVLTFIQALIINGLINENKVLPKKNYMGGALFIIISSFFKESLALSPALISATFIIICVARLFSLVRKDKAYGDIYDIGFLIALASLFYFPVIVFVLPAFIGLATVRPFSFKEWGAVLTGFLSPLFLLFTWYFWNDTTGQLIPEVLNLQPGGWLQHAGFSAINWIMAVSLALVVFIALAFLPAALYSSLIQVRKFSGVLVAFIFFTIAGFFMQSVVNQSHWVLVALPVSVILAIVMMQIKRRWVSEVIHLILILLVLAGQYLPASTFS
ncbi:MAG TPA: DUF6427 family protein [Chitinophagales bacterium]|nr:DUF6427 family protein [Chitinophagales bacterium]